MKNGPIDKILRIQLGLYIRKPGKKNLAHEKLILMRGIAVEKFLRLPKNAIFGRFSPLGSRAPAQF